MDNRKRIVIYSVVLAVLVVLLIWRCAAPTEPDLASDDPLVQVDQLALSNASDVDERLAALVEADEPAVARAAVRHMGLRKSDENRRTLESLLERSDRPDLRRVAAAAYGRHEQADVRRLETIVQREPDPRVRRGAAEGLANHASPERSAPLETLLEALRDRDEQVRRWAITGVHRIMYVRYPFDPAKPPGTQDNIIRQIRIDFDREAPTN